jgi:hypothetical protein
METIEILERECAVPVVPRRCLGDVRQQVRERRAIRRWFVHDRRQIR